MEHKILNSINLSHAVRTYFFNRDQQTLIAVLGIMIQVKCLTYYVIVMTIFEKVVSAEGF